MMQPEVKAFLWTMGVVVLCIAWVIALAVQSEGCERKCAPDQGRLVRGVVFYECICGRSP